LAAQEPEGCCGEPEALGEILEVVDGGDPQQAFNLVSPGETSYAAVAARLGGRFGVPIVHRIAPEQPES